LVILDSFYFLFSLLALDFQNSNNLISVYSSMYIFLANSWLERLKGKNKSIDVQWIFT
jgi:hypothetical protein